jgi:hypothetical protein
MIIWGGGSTYDIDEGVWGSEDRSFYGAIRPIWRKLVTFVAPSATCPITLLDVRPQVLDLAYVKSARLAAHKQLFPGNDE